MIPIPKSEGLSEAPEGEIGGRARLFLCTGWEDVGVAATSGSTSHGETLSGRIIDVDSSHWTCTSSYLRLKQENDGAKQ